MRSGYLTAPRDTSRFLPRMISPALAQNATGPWSRKVCDAALAVCRKAYNRLYLAQNFFRPSSRRISSVRTQLGGAIHSTCGRVARDDFDVSRMNYSNSPAYLLSIVSAAWFTLMAYRFQKSLALWRIGGAVLGLCVSSICLGLAHAVTLPYTNSEIRRMQWVGVTWTIVIIGITSAIIAAANRNRISSGQKIVSARTSEF